MHWNDRKLSVKISKITYPFFFFIEFSYDCMKKWSYPVKLHFSVLMVSGFLLLYCDLNNWEINMKIIKFSLKKQILNKRSVNFSVTHEARIIMITWDVTISFTEWTWNYSLLNYSLLTTAIFFFWRLEVNETIVTIVWNILGTRFLE